MENSSGKQKRIRRTYDDSYIEQAAVMRCDLGFNHQQIAEALGVTQPQATRFLQSARERGLYTESEPYLIESKFGHGELEKARSCTKINWTVLKDALKPSIRILAEAPTVHVLAAEGGSESERLRSFGRRAAGKVVDLLSLPGTNLVGISWGNTMYHLCESIVSFAYRNASKNKGLDELTFVPVAGDLLYQPKPQLTSSHLCYLLHQAINGNDEALALGTAAAYIPKSIPDSDIGVIKKYFECFANYRKIFVKGEGGSPLIDRLDTIVMSVGSSAADHVDPWLDDVVNVADIDRETLAEYTSGDVAGFFLPSPGLSTANKAKVNKINERWTGITQDHIRACAKKAASSIVEARQSPSANHLSSVCPGVIVLAAGARKADAVQACATMGMANHIIIDTEIAELLAPLSS